MKEIYWLIVNHIYVLNDLSIDSNTHFFKNHILMADEETFNNELPNNCYEPLYKIIKIEHNNYYIDNNNKKYEILKIYDGSVTNP